MSTTKLLSDRYELGDTLGYGGMSEVHHGHDVRLGREVAVKILRADLARDTIFQERFRREAQNSAALNHPAIVAVYDTGETQTEYGPLPYIVMEYVEGRTLRDIVKTEGPMDQKRAMEVMADVCAALDFSHRHGIVHRDVKPANVMISKTGAVKVMDFGIARAIHDGQSAMTQTAAVIGTAQYLSPEQARGEQVDARSDVYAAGCVLYELIAGEPPFTGDSPVAVAYQHVREDPLPPSAVNPDVSPALDAVVLKALTKGPANRYQSAAEMRTDLVRVLSDQRPSAPMVMTEDDRTQVMGAGGRTAGDYDEYDEYDEALLDEERRKRRNRMLVAAAVIGVLLIGALVWLLEPFGGEKVQAIPTVTGKNHLMAFNELQQAGFTNVDKKGVVCRPMTQGAQAPCGEDDWGKVFTVEPGEGTRIEVNERIVLSYGVPPKDFPMPKLIGKKRSEAERVLKERNLFLEPNVETVPNNDPAKAGKIAEQNPPSGETIYEGETVTLKVYDKPEMVAVTSYVGDSEETATAGLKGAGFNVVPKRVPSDQEEGTVVAQSPDGGEAVKGSSVTIEVSDGSQGPMTMPDLINATEGEAKSQLTDAGHVGEVKVEKIPLQENEKDKHGMVIRTNPDANTDMKKSDAVVLYVGEYKEEDDGGGGGGDDNPPSDEWPVPRGGGNSPGAWREDG